MNEQAKRSGAPIGNSNAAKEVRADSALHIRLTIEQKKRYSKLAAKSGKKLSALVIELLDNQSSLFCVDNSN